MNLIIELRVYTCNFHLINQDMKRKEFLKKASFGLAGFALGSNILKANENKPKGAIMKHIFYPADGRGKAEHGWLSSRFSFSFAEYYDSRNMNFGVLRVLNDDLIKAGKGFGTHPHDNMEILTIALEGALQHKDSMGNTSVIRPWEVQVMSAGSGILHSEFNPSVSEDAKILQIWMFPNKRNVQPRYDQQYFKPEQFDNQWVQLLSPDPEDEGVWVHQDAWVHRGVFEAGKLNEKTIQKPGNGAYVFIIEGSVEINGIRLNRRDAIGIWETESFMIKTHKKTDLLVFDVPMKLGS